MKTAWLVLAFIAFAVSPALPVTAADHRTPPIPTSAELAHYLTTTPARESPLSLLPPGARKRFLGSLTWDTQGLAGFDLGDLQQYLTGAEAVRVLALFGMQDIAAGIDGRSHPLGAAGRIASETPLEQQFDRWFFAPQDARHGTANHDDATALYARLLQPRQNRSGLARLGDSDAGLLFRAAEAQALDAPGAGYLDDLRLDLAELHRRGLARPGQVARVHQQLVAARRFDDANALAAEYPHAAIAPLPPLVTAPAVAAGQPTVLMLQPGGKAMLREPVDMHASPQIVVVAGCHFSVDAVRAVRADPALDALFRDHAIWLAPASELLPDVLQWNRQFPDQPMRVAWRNAEWSMLDSWNIPTFHVFRDGKLIDRWQGWAAGTGLATLREHLHRLDLLR